MSRRAAFVLLAVFCAAFAFAGEDEAPGPRTPAGPKTVITGERMNLLRKGAAVEFVGGVTLVRGRDMLKADRMVSEEKRGFTQAWGRVYLRRDDPENGVRWEVWAEEGAYENDRSSGTLIGRKEPARVKRAPLGRNAAGEVLDMEADRITFYQSEPGSGAGASTAPASMSESEGRVHVTFREPAPASRRTDVWSARSFYDGGANSARFWGPYEQSAEPAQPRVRQVEGEETRDLTGELITYFLTDRRLVVENAVRAILQNPEGKKHAPAR